jgi:hypothetical protein
MSAATLVTVEAYRVDDLTDAARDRLLDREREDAWGSWLTDEVGAMLTDYVRDRLDGVDGVEVTAWAIEHGGGAVVEGDVVNPHALARALGLPDDDRPLRLDPYHGRGSSWAGTTYVLVGDGEGWSRDDAASEALGHLIGDALDAARAWADEVTSDAAILDGLREGGWWYDRTGDYLTDVVDYVTTDDLPAWDEVGTWSGVLDVTYLAIRTYEGRDADPLAAADRLRTLGRMLDHAASEVREVELMASYRREVTS